MKRISLCLAVITCLTAGIARADDHGYSDNGYEALAEPGTDCGCRGWGDAAYLKIEPNALAEQIVPACAVRFGNGGILLRFTADKPVPVILAVSDAHETPLAYRADPDGDGFVAVDVRSAPTHLRLRSGDALVDLF